jgi:hypothetical protein
VHRPLAPITFHQSWVCFLDPKFRFFPWFSISAILFVLTSGSRLHVLLAPAQLASLSIRVTSAGSKPEADFSRCRVCGLQFSCQRARFTLPPPEVFIFTAQSLSFHVRASVCGRASPQFEFSPCGSYSPESPSAAWVLLVILGQSASRLRCLPRPFVFCRGSQLLLFCFPPGSQLASPVSSPGAHFCSHSLSALRSGLSSSRQRR